MWKHKQQNESYILGEAAKSSMVWDICWPFDAVTTIKNEIEIENENESFSYR